MLSRITTSVIVQTFNRCVAKKYLKGICHSLLPYRCKNTSINSNNLFLNNQILDKYFDEMEGELNKDSSGFTNKIPNVQLLKLIEERKDKMETLNSLIRMECDPKETSSTNEWKELLKEEKNKLQEELACVTNKLLDELVTDDDNISNITLEVKPGVGGKEAMLFANTLFETYINYVKYKKWDCFVSEKDASELGGLRRGTIIIQGLHSLKHLRHESGVHRVQRTPLTEKSGRLHTSTVTVAVLPQPTDYECMIHDKDIVVETFRASGAGGQHVNKTDSAVRITYIPSNIVVECQVDRSQIKNRQIALQKLRSKLYEIHMKSQEDEIRSSRKFQVGSGARSDKVRTYNFAQDRITDHRLGINCHNVDSFLKGGMELDEIIQKLMNLSKNNRIDFFLYKLQQKEK